MPGNPAKMKLVLVQVSNDSCINEEDQCSSSTPFSAEGEGDVREDDCVICSQPFNPEQVSSWSDKKANLVKPFCLIFGLVQFDPSWNSQFPCCLTCLEELELLDRYYKKLELVSSQLDLVLEHLLKLMATAYVTKKVPTDVDSHSHNQWRSFKESLLDKLVPAWKLNVEFHTLTEKMIKNAAFTQELMPQELTTTDEGEEIVQENFNQFNDTDQALGQDTEASEIGGKPFVDLVGDQEVKSEYNDDDDGTNAYYYVVEGGVGDEFVEEDIEFYSAASNDRHFSQSRTDNKEDVGSFDLEITGDEDDLKLERQDQATKDDHPIAECRKARKPRPKLDRTFRSRMKSLKNVKPKLNPHNKGKGRLDCHFCKKKFSSTEERSNHEKNHRLSSGDQKVYYCPFCSRDVVYRNSFLAHLENTHMKTGRVKFGDTFYFYSCDSTDCNKCFNTQQLLEEHIQRAHSSSDKPLPIKCVKCEKIFAEESNHNAHIENTHCVGVGEPPAWACEYCHLDFDMEKMLELHMPIHLVSVTRPEVPCTICGKKFRNSVALSSHKFTYHRHQRSERSYKFPFKCDDCGKRFISAKRLLRHSKRHTSGKLAYKRFPCLLCNRICRSQKGLDRHESGHKREQYRCRFCSRMLKKTVNIKRHEYNCDKDKYLESTPFFCEFCYETFVTEDELSCHSTLCTKILETKCKFCGLKCFSLANLQVHILAQHSNREAFSASETANETETQPTNKLFPCSMCDKVLNTNSSLQKHKKASHERKQCRFCNTLLQLYNYVENNWHEYNCNTEKYLESTPFLCQKCFEAFATEDELNWHRAECIEKECKVCGQLFSDLSHLKLHIRARHPDVSTEVEAQKIAVKKKVRDRERERERERNRSGFCEICGKLFRSLHTHKHIHDKHLRPHILESSRNCVFGCTDSFYKLSQVRQHYIAKHREEYIPEGSVHCNKCYKVFSNDTELKKHEESHVGRYKCEVCGKTFTASTNLRNHRYEHATDAEVFCCNVCGKVFKKPNTYKLHLKTHEKRRASSQRTNCSHCGKNIHNGRTYRLHLYNEHREHFLTDRMPFHCSICYETFPSQDNLDTHFIRHPKCQYCDRSFENKFKVSEHEVTHTGAQPYQCSTCGKRFGSDSNHRIHLKLHTGERPFHCLICPNNVGFFRRKNLEQHMQKCHASAS